MSAYKHLISGAAPNLPCVGCLQIDDFDIDFGASVIWDLAERFFRECNALPHRVTYSMNGSTKSRRVTPKTFARVLREQSTGAIRRISVSSKGEDDIADVYAPYTYCGFELIGRIRRAFFYSTERVQGTIADWSAYARIFLHRDGDVRCAGAVFDYPLIHSPVAYFVGISFKPNIRAVGSVSDRDEQRVTNWRDHCWRGFCPRDGFLRDVYPQNILSSVHLERRIENVPLAEWIRSDQTRGELELFEASVVWTIPESSLERIQFVLDQHRFLLASFSPDDLAHG